MQLRVTTPAKPPADIVLGYGYHDGVHTFCIEEIPGLVVLDWSLRRAYDDAIRGMRKLVECIYGSDICYDILDDFTEFEKYKRVRCQLRTIH